MRVRHDYQAAVGGMWEEIGRLQLDYLVANGLQPHHTLLDIGCGTLRAGRHFIPYLQAGRYTGFDLSPAAINAARRLVLTEGIAEKRPRLFVNRSGELTFPYSQRYDFLLAHSVFTHLPEANIELAMAHIGRVMHPGSLFFFTFDDAEKFRRTTTIFPYPFEFFRTLAGRYGFDIERRFHYPHPRGQSMAIVRTGSAARGQTGETRGRASGISR